MPKHTNRYRRADNGRFTTEAYAKAHKRTTIRETIRKENGRKKKG